MSWDDALKQGRASVAQQNVARRGCFYHLYTSEDGRFQRGLHLFDEVVRDGVKMPGYPKVKLSIARYQGHPSNDHKLDADGKIVQRDGKSVFIVVHYGQKYEVVDGDPVVYAAPGHEDGAVLDEALVAQGE